MPTSNLDARESLSGELKPSRDLNAGSARRDLAIALSLANLCYLRVWSELLTYSRSDTYLMKSPPGPAALAGVMANVLILAGLLWGLARFARRRLSRSGFRWVEMGFLGLLVLPGNAGRAVAAHHFSYLRSPLFEVLGQRGVAVLAACLGIAAVAALLLTHRKTAPLVGSVLVAFLPFCALTFGQGLWRIATYDAGSFEPRPLLPALPARNSPRVAWILFDEWDYRLTFVDPAEGQRFPELERFGRQATAAQQALPPGPETPISIPAYFTGRPVQEVEYDGSRELQIRFGEAAGLRRGAGCPRCFRKRGHSASIPRWWTGSTRPAVSSPALRPATGGRCRCNSTAWATPFRSR